MSFRKVSDNDLMKEWYIYREETIATKLYREDREHKIEFDEICAEIIKSIPKQNREFVRKKLNELDDNFFDYICYWNEKFYRNGFCDGIELIVGCLDK